MPQQLPQFAHDGQPQPEPALAFAHGVIDLMKFVKDRVELIGGDADAGIPHLDPHHRAVVAAAQQDAPLGRGVFDRIGDQIAQHHFDQARIAAQHGRARDHPQCDRLRLGQRLEFGPQPFEQVDDGKGRGADLQHAGLDLVDVEQRIQHPRHRIQQQPKSPDQILRLSIGDAVQQHVLDQGKRLQRLAQIMARHRQKARFAPVRLFRRVPRFVERGSGAEPFGDVDEGDDHPLHPVIMGAIGKDPALEP